MTATNNNAKKIRNVSLVILFAVFCLYIGFQSKNLLEGPVIKIEKPTNGGTLESEIIEIAGTAKNISYIYLNDRKIFVDTDGHFSEKWIAPEGYSIIKLSALDKFGRKEEKFIKLILNDSSPLVLSSNSETEENIEETEPDKENI